MYHGTSQGSLHLPGAHTRPASPSCCRVKLTVRCSSEAACSKHGFKLLGFVLGGAHSRTEFPSSRQLITGYRIGYMVGAARFIQLTPGPNGFGQVDGNGTNVHLRHVKPYLQLYE